MNLIFLKTKQVFETHRIQVEISPTIMHVDQY
jgi:hypothetical protein